MGVIDAQGRVFGLINVIDLLVVVILLLAIFAGYSFINYAEKKLEDEEPVYIYLYINATVAPEYVDKIVIGERVVKDNTTVLEILGKEKRGETHFVSLRLLAAKRYSWYSFMNNPIERDKILIFQTSMGEVVSFVDSFKPVE